MFKNNDLKCTVPLFAALAALLIAVPLRVYQYIRLINPGTGFYDEVNAAVYIFFAVLAIAVAVGIFIPFSRKNTLRLVPVSSKSTGFAVVSLLFAVALIVDSASQLMDYFDLFTKGAEMGTMVVKDYISAQGGTLLLLQAITGALSAVYFFVTGVTVGLGNSDSSKYKLLALLPVIWCIFRLLYRFKRTISFINVSDLLLELFLIVFSLLFLFSLAQLNSKIDTYDEDSSMKSVFWTVFGYGIPAALLALTIFLSRLAIVISGNSEQLNELYGVNVSDFAFAIFTVYTCISTLKAESKATEE